VETEETHSDIDDDDDDGTPEEFVRYHEDDEDWTVRFRNLLEGTGLSAWVAPSPGLRRRGSSAGVPRRATGGGGHDQRAAKRAEIESFEYYPGDSAVYREWLGKQPIYRNYDRWLLIFFVGLAVGLMARVLYTIMHTLSDLKYATLRHLLNRRQVFLAWLFNTVYSSALAFAAAYPVAHIAPEAGGSGVPEVMAYLNGCNIPRVFNLRVFVVKFISTICSVASGLPVGPEGPMIHLGAMMGAGLSQGDSATLGFTTPCAQSGGWLGFRRFRNDKDKRDFITAGAACGVATAFGAPIGGLLFAYEEVASHWRPSLAVLTFFACMTAMFTDKFLESFQESIMKPGGYFGAVSPSFDTAFQVNRNVSTHLLSIFPASLVGVLCGALAALFTATNLVTTKLRKVHIGGDKFKQVMEPVVVMVVYTLIAVIIPLMFPCTSTGCILDEATVPSAGIGAGFPPGPAEFRPADDEAGGAVFCEGGSDHLHRVVEQSMMTFTCRSHWNAADVAGLGGNATNATETKDYNELATLLHVSSDDAIRHLLTRGTHREFGYGPLLAFLVIYSVGACYIAGSSIASGLFVPMLVMGAAVGRLVGLMLLDLAISWGYTEAELAAGGIATAWVDPGVFALLGAGAFMGGVTRLTISLAVIVMEMSGEQHFLLPILLGITVAKWTADSLHKPLYHALLEVKSAPFLPDEPAGAAGLHLHDVSEIMRPAPLTTLRERESVNTLRRALKETSHQGFPVVRHVDGVGEVLVGLVSRAHLRVLLRAAASSESRRSRDADRGAGVNGGAGESRLNGRRVGYEELDRRADPGAPTAQMALADDRKETELSDLNLGARRSSRDGGNGQFTLTTPPPRRSSDGAGADLLDLRPYLNRSAPRVPNTYSVARVYDMFRSLGFRHLVVVDDCNRVVGIVTRKELLDDWLDERLDHLGRDAMGFRRGGGRAARGFESARVE
jgi:chloride channel 7